MSNKPIESSYQEAYPEGYKHYCQQRAKGGLNSYTYKLGNKYYYDTPIWNTYKPIEEITPGNEIYYSYSNTSTTETWPTYLSGQSTTNSITYGYTPTTKWVDEPAISPQEQSLLKKAAKIEVSNEILQDTKLSPFPKKIKNKIRKKKKKK